MAVCRIAARGNTFIWIYVRLHAGGGAFDTKLSHKILIKLLTIIKGHKIKQYQEKWLQHVQRMDTNRLPKQALQYKPKGRKT